MNSPQIQRDRKLKRFLGIVIVLGALLALGLVIFRTERRDVFQGHTDMGRIEISLVRVEGAERDDLLGLVVADIDGKRISFYGLKRSLPVNSKVGITFRVSRYGKYQRGGGPVFHGKSYVGTHPKWAKVIEATSSRPDVISVQVLDAARHGPTGMVMLNALSPGESVLTFTVKRLDTMGNVVNYGSGAAIDSVVFRVLQP